MNMASLSASLVTRTRRVAVKSSPGDVFLLNPKAKPIAVVPQDAASSRKAARAMPKGKPARQQKTLRLARETHRALKRLAKQKGQSQQSLMEEAVLTMLEQETVTSLPGQRKSSP